MTERHQQDSQQLELDVRIPGQRTDQAGPAPVAAPRAAASPTGNDGWQSLPWRTVARVSISRSLLTWVVTMLVLGVMPFAVGWTPRVIMSGSMEPRIHTGDVVVTRPVDGSEIGPGTVITTLDPDKAGKTRTHRMVERDDDGMVVTKGDANPDRDSTPVADADVLGAGVLRVPFIGRPAYWLSVGDLAPLGLSFVVLTGAVLGSFRPRGRRSDDASRRGGGTAGPGAPHRPERRVRRARRAGAAVTVAMAAALVVTGVPGSYAAFAASTAGPASSFGAGQQFYPYRATVLADAPSFYWRLDETGGGSVADATGNGRGATADNVAFGRAGALSSETASTAGGFTDTAVTSNGSTGLGGTYSVEAWVRTTSSGPLLAFTSILNTGIVDRALYVGRDGTVRFGNSLGARVVGTKVNDGQWHHVVYTNAGSGPSGSRGRLYVDGRSVGQGSAVTGATAGYWDAGRSFFLGLGWQSQPNDAFAGDLDELAVYPDVLTPTEVADHFAASGR